MSKYNDSPPVDQLLEYGDGYDKPWPNYLELGFTKADVPELIGMALDLELHKLNEKETMAVWAPIHAWRALGQLQAEEAAKPLLDLLDQLPDAGWAVEELPLVFGMIGPGIIPTLSANFAQDLHDLYFYVSAAAGLKEIAERHPSSRTQCVAALAERLENHAQNDPTLNGFIIYYLSELQAVEATSLMERAFAAKTVEEEITGGWGDVQYQLGLIGLTHLPHKKRTIGNRRR